MCIAWLRNAHSIILLCLGIILSSCSNADDDKHMLSDLTIYLQSPILGQGGTVIIVPREVAIDRWHSQPEAQNPARSDAYLASYKPLPQDARRLGVVVRDKVSIVQFDYPQGGTFTFRFAPAPGSDFPWGRLKTKEIGTGGEGEEMDEKTGQIIKAGSAVHIHVLGTEVTEADSRAVESVIKIGALQSRYACRYYELAIACDASEAAQ